MTHPMMTKALRGLEAVARLKDDGGDKFTDDASSRLYYALYHACWAFLQTRTPVVDFNKRDCKGVGTSYIHAYLEKTLDEQGEATEAAGSLWWPTINKAKKNRVTADYRDEKVEKVYLDRLLPDAVSVIESLRRHMKKDGK